MTARDATSNALDDDKLIEEDDLEQRTERIRTRILDESINISRVKKYFTNSAWKRLQCLLFQEFEDKFLLPLIILRVKSTSCQRLKEHNEVTILSLYRFVSNFSLYFFPLSHQPRFHVLTFLSLIKLFCDRRRGFGCLKRLHVGQRRR